MSALAHPNRARRERLRSLVRRVGDVLVVPAPVVIESVTGSGPRDATTNRVLSVCEIVALTEAPARRAGALRHAARRGSAVDAAVVAIAEMLGGGVVLTGDRADLDALVSHASGVAVVELP